MKNYEFAPSFFAQVSAEDVEVAADAGLPESVELNAQSRAEAVRELAAKLGLHPVTEAGNGLEVAVNLGENEVVYILDEN